MPWHPDVGGFIDLRSSLTVPAKVCRHYADDRCRIVVQRDLASPARASAAEASPPQCVAGPRDSWLSVAPVLVEKSATDDGVRSEYREQIGGCIMAQHLFRFAVSG